MGEAASSIELIVKGNKDIVFETLTEIPGVVCVKFEKEEKELSYFTVFMTEQSQVKNNILTELSERRIPIYTLH